MRSTRSTLFSLMRGTPVLWLVVGLCASVLLVGVELAFALVIKEVLVKLGLAPPDVEGIASLMPLDMEWGVMSLAVLLCGVAFGRSLLQVLTAIGSSYNQVSFARRLRKLFLHDMLLD